MSEFETQKRNALNELENVLSDYSSFVVTIESVEEYDGEEEVICEMKITNRAMPKWTCYMYLNADLCKVKLNVYEDVYEDLTEETMWRFLFFDTFEG